MRLFQKRLVRPVQSLFATALALATLGPVSALAGTVVLQPGEADSKDVFVYSFAIPGAFGIPTPARETNFNSVPAGAVPFNLFLGASETVPFRNDPNDPNEPLREHDTRTLLQFDLSGILFDPSRVASATLDLFAVPGLPPFNDPSVANPVTLNLRPVTEDWDEDAATFDNAPATGAVETTATLTGAPQTASFDVTGLVMQWLTDPASNFGIEISQAGIVALPQGPGERDRFAAALFASSAFSDPSLHPRLRVSEVPLPAPLALLAGGIALLGGVGAARRRA